MEILYKFPSLRMRYVSSGYALAFPTGSDLGDAFFSLFLDWRGHGGCPMAARE